MAQRKSPKKTLRSNSNLPSELWSGFFDETSLSHRKTMHILCIALRVSGSGMDAASTRISMGRRDLLSVCRKGRDSCRVMRHDTRAQLRSCRRAYRPNERAATTRAPLPIDPEGGAQEVRRFSTRQGCLVEKSRPGCRRQI